MKTERVAIAYRYPFVRPESEQNSSHLQIDCAGSGNRDSMFRHSVIHDLLSAEDDRSRSPGDFHSTEASYVPRMDSRGDEASAGHSLAVARTRYIKGRQAL
jgi:hypothetical protein